MNSSTISFRFFKVVIFIAFGALSVSTLVSFYIMGEVEYETQKIVKKQMEIKLNSKITNSLQQGVTNAVAITQNQELKDAIKNYDREKAYNILNSIDKTYAKYTNYKKSQLHIHTKDVSSFLRSWDKERYGDSLVSFRHTINKVKKTQKPVLDIEVGWADLVIRSIIPIMENNEYIGSFEFIQDFSHIRKELENEDKYLLNLIDLKLLKNKPKQENIIDQFALMQKTHNSEYFELLKKINLQKLLSDGFIHKDGKYFSVLPIVGFNNSFIGYYIIAQDYKQVQSIISKSNDITYTFMILMGAMAILIALILHYTVQKIVVENIAKVSVGLISFFDFLNKKRESVDSIDIDSDDEIGIMAKNINENIQTVSKLILKENQEDYIKDAIRGLGGVLTKANSINDVTKSSLNYLCDYMNIPLGTFYLYHEELLKLNASFGFEENSNQKLTYKLGDSLIGQVAIDKKPIFLDTISKDSLVISSSTVDIYAKSIYIYPILYKKKLLGVVEFASTTIFEENDKLLIEQMSQLMATAVFTAIQNENVKSLLEQSEISNKELQTNQVELEEANAQMQEQQAQLEEANSQMQEQQLQLQQSEIELKEQNEKLQNSNRYKSEFLANMSHELRTPLNSIILLSSMMSQNKKENLTVDDIKKANIINSSGEELLRLINDVLDLSKVEAGRMELMLDNIDSTTFITNIKDMFEASIQNKGLDFIIEDNYNSIFVNDESKLSQVLRNFLSNALKFTHEGFIKVSIDRTVDQKIKISVEDTGIGIPEDKQELVFQAFTQADGSTSREYGGTGLGLSITKEFVKLMGGEITLSSQDGVGSVFSIIIPSKKEVNIATKKIEIEKSIQDDYPLNKEIIDDRNQIDSTQNTFLIIEDNKTFSMTLKEFINEKGELCLIANNGKDGLKLAHQYSNIQGILLDIGLPDIDGIDLLKELKSDINTKKIPVYIISGEDISSKTGINKAIGFKQKPLSSDDFNTVFTDIKQFNEKNIKDLLVVEDDKIQREAMIEFISNSDVNINGVDNIDEAIKEINGKKYDAIIVDLTLNGKSGLAICDYIKDNNISTPIIVYTGKELSNEEEQKIKNYTDSIIIKSANSQHRLLEEVDMFLHRVKKSNKKDDKKIISNSDISFEEKKILVVDDDMRNTFVLVEILEDKGAEVLVASNGQEALDILDKNKDTNIVLMDIMMPVMDGFEAIEHIRENEAIKDIPIIAVTAKAMVKDKERSLEVGANDFLTKPLNLDTFVGVVQAWIK